MKIKAISLVVALHSGLAFGKAGTSQIPLIEAVKLGHVEDVKRLINEKADVNHKDNDGMAPLHYAVFHGRLDVVKSLINDCKADIKQTDKDGWEAIHYAAFKGRTEIAKFLVKDCKINVNTADNEKRTPLYLAEFHKHHALAKYLRENGARG
ncbi:MAG: ankyrin repeat domain-containing protein [Deltaproteobacteria bacterium]|nr:ankyrin repeat domain-containing protein [Deltaproteobacteria bacterium]